MKSLENKNASFNCQWFTELRYFIKIMTMRVKMKIPHCLLYFALLLIPGQGFAQSVIQEISSYSNGPETSELFVEKIKTISNSKRIFILTNENKLIQKGDFVSILIEGNLVTRALVAKATEERVGIKMLKIYSLALWRQLRRGLDIQIIRGDDSYYRKAMAKKQNVKKSDEAFPSITEEEDLFNNKLIGEVDDEKKRVLPNDNLVGVSYGFYSAKNSDGGNQNYGHWGLTWAYQASANIFVEGLFGYSSMSQFPASGVNSTLTNLTARLKYTFALPLYSYAQPYVGFQNTTIATSTDSLLDSEAQLVSDSENTGIILGVTFLRRLVPGWFVKADLGTDLINVGFSVEF